MTAFVSTPASTRTRPANALRVLLSLAVSIAAAGCDSADSESTDPANGGGKADNAGTVQTTVDLAEKLIKGEMDQTVSLPLGSELVLHLDDYPASGTDNQWRVYSSDRTFGSPSTVEHVTVSGEDRLAMTWGASPFLSVGKAHLVTFIFSSEADLSRGPEGFEPEEVLNLTVKIVDEDGSSDESDDDADNDGTAPELGDDSVHIDAQEYIDAGDTSPKISVAAGADLVVDFEYRQFSDKYWTIYSTSRSFGYPVGYPDAELYGEDEIQRMTWMGNPLNGGSSQQVTFVFGEPTAEGGLDDFSDNEIFTPVFEFE